MECQQAQDWLLQTEDPHPARCTSPEVAAHLRHCTPCRGLAGRLVRLEDAWRSIPTPARADEVRAAFLEQLPPQPQPQPPPQSLPAPAPRPRVLRFLKTRRWAVAALLLLTTSVGILLIFPRQQTQAAPEVVERLIQWNLDLAQTEARDQRKLIYDAQAANLKAAVEQARLPASDRALADTLLENGTWLADNDDPLAEADRFNDVADQLLTRMDEATDRKDIPGLKRLADIYRGVADQGVEANIEEAVNAGPVVGERKKQLEQAVRSNAGRRAKLVKLLERAPEAARPEIRHAIEHRRHPSHKAKKKHR